ncbi:MAG: hypothetical protein SO170_03055 [Butyribacter sp.]|nr:hypothetical protein [Butyribacter sp.]
MQRRKEYTDQEQRFLQKIQTEHSLFKFKMLSGTNREVYDSCNIIRFYETVYEYFIYKESLNQSMVEIGLQEDGVLDGLYQTYLKYEWLQIETWEDIEELLKVYVNKYQEKGTMA